MSTDAILLAERSQKFTQIVADALVYCRDDLSALARSPLAQSTLIGDCLLPGEVLSLQLRQLGMRALLRWGVDKLQPLGYLNQPSAEWTSKQLRVYYLLYYPYFGGMTFSELEEKMEQSTENLFKIRKQQALPKLAAMIREELQNPIDSALRKTYFLVERYRALSEPQQQLLGLLAVFRQPLAEQNAVDLATIQGFVHPGAKSENVIVDDLVQSGLLVRTDEGVRVMVHPEVRALLNG